MTQAFLTVPPPSRRLLIFARLPELGRVKTRLAAGIGEPRALDAYRAMLRDTLRSAGGLNDGTAVEVMWSPTESATAESLRASFPGFPVAMQTGATLGDRLAMAFSERFFFHRTSKIVAIGVDDPLLPADTILHAFALLDSCDWAIGPAVDGGYYLIACRAAAFDPEAFEAIDWGSNTVFATTLLKLSERQRNVAVLPRRRDIDDAEDLRHFATEPNEGELVALLRQWDW